MHGRKRNNGKKRDSGGELEDNSSRFFCLECEKIAYSHGIKPSEFWQMTYREYCFYVNEQVKTFELKEKLEWQRTASLLCLLANINRDTKKRKKAYEVDEFMPCGMREKKERKVMSVNAMYEELKKVTIFMGGEVKE